MIFWGNNPPWGEFAGIIGYGTAGKFTLNTPKPKQGLTPSLFRE